MKNGLNWVMLVSLVLVFVSGILLKPMPGMWLGILHGVSGLVLFISAMVHTVGRIRRGKKPKLHNAQTASRGVSGAPL